MVFMAVGCHNGISGFRGKIFYSVEYGRIIMCYQIRHNYAYYFGLLLPQALCEWVRAVVELLGKLLYASSHFLTNFVAVS